MACAAGAAQNAWKISEVGISHKKMRGAIQRDFQPTMISKPKIVENQCGFTDKIQSIDMNVTLKPKKISPGPASAAIFPCACGSPSFAGTNCW